jgi:chromosome partitioning protein
VRRVAVSIFKGGTGKSSVAVNVAVGIARRGRRVLIVDLDAQASATRMLGGGFEPPTIYDVLVDRVEPARAIHAIADGLDLLPSARSLAPIDSWLTSQMRREEILSRRLADLAGYDYLILDCAPAWSLLNINALVFADELWLPVSMDFLSLVGVQQIEGTLRTIRDELDHEIPARHVIPNFYERRTRKSREVLAALEEAFGDAVTPAIRKNVRISEAPSFAQSIFDYAPRSIGAEDFEQLVGHILGEGA